MKKYKCWIVIIAALFISVSDTVADERKNDASISEAPSLDKVMVDLSIPLFSEHFNDTPVAIIDDTPITLGDLNRELTNMHADMKQEKAEIESSLTGLLDRLIATRLILIEAQNIGLQERYGIQEQLKEFRETTLLKELMALHNKDVQVDPAEVEKMYRKMSRALKMEGFYIVGTEEAGALEKELESGRELDDVVAAFIVEGKATREENDFILLKKIKPVLARAFSELQVGGHTQIFQEERGLVLFRLLEERFEEDPKAEEEAFKIAYKDAVQKSVGGYVASLEKKHTKLNEKLLKNLDFSMEPSGFLGLGKPKPVDFNKFLSNDRVLAQFKGDGPEDKITIADLARELDSKLYHGADKASKSESFNEKKDIVFKNMLYKKVGRLEAISLGIDISPEYLGKVQDYTNSLIFGAFVNKIVAQEVTLNNEEIEQYLVDHVDEYSTPVMVRMKSLVFSSGAQAKDALDKLRKGTDFKWISSNAEGQVDKDTKGLLEFNNTLLSVTSLPEGINQSVSKIRPGEAFVYESPKGHNYLLVLNQLVPSEPKSFDAVKKDISRIVFNKKLKIALDGWVEKLKEAYETKVFILNFNI